jgi:hypothetical protein
MDSPTCAAAVRSGGRVGLDNLRRAVCVVLAHARTTSATKPSRGTHAPSCLTVQPSATRAAALHQAGWSARAHHHSHVCLRRRLCRHRPCHRQRARHHLQEVAEASCASATSATNTTRTIRGQATVACLTSSEEATTVCATALVGAVSHQARTSRQAVLEALAQLVQLAQRLP